MRRVAALIALAVLGTAAPAAAAPLRAPDGLEGKRHKTTTARTAQLGSGDPMLDEQWPLAPDSPVQAQAAWTRSTGEGVVVAVVDSGADLRHPDLAPNLWRNPGEIAGNRIDDDRNGFVDDVHGADVIGGDGDPHDGNGHGTHVAGIVAARAGNGLGVAGLAGRAKIMVVRVLDDDAAGDTYTVAEGVRYAVRNGARIINLSLSGPAPDHDLIDAIAEARRAGALVVAAVGNQGRDLAVLPVFPASLPDENVVGVAATEPGGLLSRISNRGRGADIAAPGESVLSTALGGRYEWRTGTSMAAPHVAATLALIAAARPDLDWRGLRAAVLGSARRGRLAVATGTLDAAAALTAAGAAPTVKAKKKVKKKKKASKKKKKKASKKKKAKRKKGRKASKKKGRSAKEKKASKRKRKASSSKKRKRGRASRSARRSKR